MSFIVAAAVLCFGPMAKGFAPATKHSFAVSVSGQGPAVILIPGLMSGGGVWDGTVDHLKSHYTCHVITLPGFAGVPPIKPPMLSTVRDEIEAYVTDQRLDRPVLIGHSLGGTLALWLASDKPGMFGGVVSVDGVPYLGALQDPKQTPATLQPVIASLKKYFGSLSDQGLADANAVSLPTMISEPVNVKTVAAQSNRSDPRSAGEAIAEMLQTDLRPQMSQLSAPLLLVVPGGKEGTDAQSDVIKARYEAQIASAPQHQLVVAPKSLHFVMLDAPAFFFEQLDEFLPRIIRRG